MPWKQDYTICDEKSLDDAEVRWPDGRRCAIHIVVDLSVASGPDGITPRDLASPAAVFAANDGLDLLLAALAKHKLRATFAVPAVIAECYPARIKDIAARGHEIAAHGFKGEDVSRLSRDEEAARIELATRLLTDIAGTRPSGWFSLPRQRDAFAGGSISANTVDLLLAAHYGYLGNGLADDLPHYWVTDFQERRAILTLPYYYHFDDQFFCLFPTQGTGLENCDMLLRNWRAELAAQYERGRCFSMTLHPQHIGWCHRMAGLEAFLAELACLPGLWHATGGECARYWSNAYPAGRSLKLEPSIWRDYPGSLS